MRWYEISTDPNSWEAREWRAAIVNEAWRPAVKDRNAFFADRCRGLRVLDIGCVDHIVGGCVTADLHRALARSAAVCVGVDANEDGVRRLCGEGYRIEMVDITDPCFAVAALSEFDVVVAGEVIEHLENMEAFIDNMQKMIAPGGAILLSSPNPYQLSNLLGFLKHRHSPNVDHVNYVFPSGMAELADRHGLQLREWRGVECFVSPSSFIQWMLQKLALVKYPHSIIHCSNLIYELSRTSGPMVSSNVS